MQSKNGKTLARGKISSILEKCIYITCIRLNLKTVKIIALEALGCALCQVVFFQHVDVKPSVLFLSAMRQSNCSAPIPPRAPRGHHFFLVSPVSSSLHFCLASPYINTLITLFSSAPPFLSLYLISTTHSRHLLYYKY